MWQTLYQAWEPNPKPKPMEFNFKECSIDPRFPYKKLLGLKREKVGWVFRIQNPFTKTQLTGVAGRSMTQRGNERRIPHKCPDYAADALRHPRRGEPRQSQSGGPTSGSPRHFTAALDRSPYGFAVARPKLSLPSNKPQKCTLLYRSRIDSSF